MLTYSSIIPNSFRCLLFSKLCQHNWSRPSKGTAARGVWGHAPPGNCSWNHFLPKISVKFLVRRISVCGYAPAAIIYLTPLHTCKGVNQLVLSVKLVLGTKRTGWVGWIAKASEGPSWGPEWHTPNYAPAWLAQQLLMSSTFGYLHPWRLPRYSSMTHCNYIAATSQLEKLKISMQVFFIL